MDATKAFFTSLAALVTGGTMTMAHAQSFDFDRETAGQPPEGWLQGITGRGAARWIVEADATAPSAPNVLRQSGVATFAWIVRREAKLEDGFVEVKFKPLDGKEDQAGGVVWRWKDGDNYYVARANALENNVSLYYTQGGRRITIKYVDAPVAAKTWHVLRVNFAGKRVSVALDGKTYIEHEDGHIAGSGAVGLWTKADSVTAFDDFRFGPSSR